MISNLVAHLPKFMESFPKSSTELLYIAPRSPGFNVGSVIRYWQDSRVAVVPWQSTWPQTVIVRPTLPFSTISYCRVQLKTAVMVRE